ncbi:MAG: hypothetical protein ABSE73_28490 [Planctomycetota bacterium]
MLSAFRWTRAVVLGVLVAAVAFSYALATSARVSAGSAGATGRAIGSVSAVAFLNPLLASGDRDLGDAIIGSSLSRFCLAAGGVAPYTFNLLPGAGTQNTGLSLYTNGLVSGTLAGTFAGNQARFGVSVTDSLVGLPQTAQGMFDLNVVSGNTFRFALDRLGDAWQGRLYRTQVFNLVNGAAPYTFSQPAYQWANLAAAGFTLDLATGMLSGVPISDGPLTFHVDCQDKNGTPALSRTGSGTGQDVILNVLPDKPVSSGVVAIGIVSRAGAGTGRDGVLYTGLINLGSLKLADLQGGTLELDLGGWVSLATDTFDSRGKAGRFASLNSKGLLKISVAKDTIDPGWLFPQMLALVTIRDSHGAIVLQAGEMLQFTIRQSRRGTAYSYRTGPNPGGAFFLTSVLGRDDRYGNGDAWKVGFIALPSCSQSFFGDTASVSIGACPLSIAVSGTGVLTGTGSFQVPNSIASLSLNWFTGKGSLTTSFLDAAKTGIPVSANPGKYSAGFPFPVSLTLTDIRTRYQGEGALQVYPVARGWTDKRSR